MRPLLIILLIVVTGAVLALLFRSGDDLLPGDGAATGSMETTAERDSSFEPVPSPEVDPVAPPLPKEELPAGARVAQGVSPDPRFTRLTDGRSLSNEGYAAARELHRPGLSPEEDLEQLEAVFGLYRWAYEEVPEGGDNYEMMAVLTGNNPHKVVFFPPDHGSFDGEGNLLDRWGTAYFFHKISGQEVDVVSAGPDRRLWTPDDLSLGLTDDYGGEYETASSE